jgi:hypothetical protein
MTNHTRLTGMQHTGIPHDWEPVTPSDSDDLPNLAFGIRVETAGAVAVRTLGGGDTTRTYTLAVGHELPCVITRVLSTGTTASDIFVAVAD